MWGIVLNDIGLAELSPLNKTMVQSAVYVVLLMGTIEFCMALFVVFIGFWLVRFSVIVLGAFLLHVAWAGVQGGRHGRPSARLIHYVYGNMAVACGTWLYGMAAF